MPPPCSRCAVCPSTDIDGVVVAGAPLLLCAFHREKLGAAARFDDLAAAFAALGSDRRAIPDRRRRDRRQFPPRPEGRRHGTDRRANRD